MSLDSNQNTLALLPFLVWIDRSSLGQPGGRFHQSFESLVECTDLFCDLICNPDEESQQHSLNDSLNPNIILSNKLARYFL